MRLSRPSIKNICNSCSDCHSCGKHSRDLASRNLCLSCFASSTVTIVPVHLQFDGIPWEILTCDVSTLPSEENCVKSKNISEKFITPKTILACKHSQSPVNHSYPGWSAIFTDVITYEGLCYLNLFPPALRPRLLSTLGFFPLSYSVARFSALVYPDLTVAYHDGVGCVVRGKFRLKALTKQNLPIGGFLVELGDWVSPDLVMTGNTFYEERAPDIVMNGDIPCVEKHSTTIIDDPPGPV